MAAPPWASLSPDPRRVLPTGGGAFLGNLAGGFDQGRQVFHDRQTADAVNTYLDGIGPGQATPGRTLGNLAAPPLTAPVGPVERQALGPVQPSQFDPLFAAAGEQYGVDPLLLSRVAAAESSYDPTAVSPAGAQGLMQIMPGTAGDLGVDPFDPAQAVDGSARYLAQHQQTFGNEGLALMAYNWGQGNLQEWLRTGADPSRVPAETRNYVQQITGQPIEAWSQGQGGQPRPAAPTVGAGAAQGQQSPFSPRDIVLLRAMAANPATLGQALELITGAMGGAAGAEYGFTNVDGTLVRTNPQTGVAEPVFTPQQGPATPDFGDESSLRGAFDRLTGDFRLVERAYQQIDAVASNATGAGDMATIFAFMKMLDPNSVVRETEYANAQNATGVPDRIRNIWNQFLDGVRLTPEQRIDFQNQAASLFAAAQVSYNQTADYYRGLAQQYGMDPNRIVMPAAMVPPQAPQVPVAPAAAPVAAPSPTPAVAPPPPVEPVPQQSPAAAPTATYTLDQLTLNSFQETMNNAVARNMDPQDALNAVAAAFGVTPEVIIARINELAAGAQR